MEPCLDRSQGLKERGRTGPRKKPMKLGVMETKESKNARTDAPFISPGAEAVAGVEPADLSRFEGGVKLSHYESNFCSNSLTGGMGLRALRPCSHGADRVDSPGAQLRDYLAHSLKVLPTQFLSIGAGACAGTKLEGIEPRSFDSRNSRPTAQGSWGRDSLKQHDDSAGGNPS